MTHPLAVQPQAFPTGRRLKTLRAIAALQPTDRALRDLLAEAITHDQRTHALERELDRLSQTTSELRALNTDIDQVDLAMDKSLNHLHDTLRAAASQTDDRGQAAADLLDALFPCGAEPITSLPYLDQLGAVDTLLEDLHGPLADAVARAHVQAEVKNIQALSVAYRQRLSELTPEELAAEQLCNARAQGQAFLRAVLDAIAALPDPASRAPLLAPALQQQAEIDACLRRGGFVPDLDPNS